MSSEVYCKITAQNINNKLNYTCFVLRNVSKLNNNYLKKERKKNGNKMLKNMIKRKLKNCTQQKHF